MQKIMFNEVWKDIEGFEGLYTEKVYASILWMENLSKRMRI